MIYIQVVGIIAVGLAAILWARAAFIHIPDNIDTIVAEIQRAARWNAAAAVSACVAFLCQAMVLWFSVGEVAITPA